MRRKSKDDNSSVNYACSHRTCTILDAYFCYLSSCYVNLVLMFLSILNDTMICVKMSQRGNQKTGYFRFIICSLYITMGTITMSVYKSIVYKVKQYRTIVEHDLNKNCVLNQTRQPKITIQYRSLFFYKKNVKVWDTSIIRLKLCFHYQRSQIQLILRHIFSYLVYKIRSDLLHK